MLEQQNSPILSETFGEAIGELEKSRIEKAREQKKKDFELRIKQLTAKAAEMQTLRGPEDNITVLLTSFLDVAIEMSTLMETMSSINVAMECLTDAIGFLDAAIDFDNALMDQSLEHPYGFLERWKMRRKMKKTIKNNAGRMLAISKGLEMKYHMAQDMMKALAGVGNKLKKSINKSNNKKSNATGSGTQTAAQKAIAEYLGTSGNAPASSPSSAPTASSKGGDDGYIDDIA